ncbi:hypothetical protein XELAEV_18004899mg [Xenopus laevis]|uniref:Uncharacterized protein n=1 Tax=Xenopus laevis TaxID=8355 RepID=A0A974I2E0_XENLA|nr:hypothetical protein XELAEV_18004899mg [Xenopus laevis]
MNAAPNQLKFIGISTGKTIKSILSLQFLTDDVKTVSQSTEVVEQQSYVNRSTSLLKCTFKFEKTLKEKSEFSKDHGFTVAAGNEGTFEAGIPCIGDVKTKVSLPHKWNLFTSNEREVSISVNTNVEVQGRKAVRLEATIKKAKNTISYRAEVLNLDGHKVPISGTWTGDIYHDLVVKQEDVFL